MIELLVATAMMVFVTAAAVSMLVSVMQAQPKNTQRADQIGFARNAIEKMTADIRQGTKAVPAGRTGVTLTTLCDKSGGATESCQVVYSCAQEAGTNPATYKCTRKAGTESAVTVVGGLANAAVFCYVPSTTSPKCAETNGTEPGFVGVTVELRGSGKSGFTVVEDGAALHNSTTYRGS